jgi:hypothetical protein
MRFRTSVPYFGTKSLGDMAVNGDERTEVAEYFPNASAYIVGLPGHLATLDANNATVAQTWLYYDGSGSYTTPPTLGRPTQKCAWLNGGTNPCVQMSYDQYGNVTTVTDARQNTTTTTYDETFHTFPHTVTTPATPNAPQGLVTTTTYDARFGVILTQTDPNTQTATNTYDVFGRLSTTTKPLTSTQTVMGDVGSKTP